jgi:hypothetical protein
MNKVVCYPRSCEPESFKDDIMYVELLSNSTTKAQNVVSVGARLLFELKHASIVPTTHVLDFALIALSIVSTDKIILRKDSPDGWTRNINLTIYVYDANRWMSIREKLEVMLRFLSGDFWSLHFVPIVDKIVEFKYQNKLRDADCVCLLSGGADSLVGAIDLVSLKKSPLFVSQIVRGDAENQKLFASRLGQDNLCQWSCSVNRSIESEDSTRARSIMFFAFALLATCVVKAKRDGRKEIIVPENGYMSLNISLNANRIGSLSTKTTHPIYMMFLQEIWNDVGFDVNLILPYLYKTKGEVLAECKSQSILKETISHSISCGKYRRHALQHCGVCVPCLVRRAAFLKAGLSDKTNKGYLYNNLKNANSSDVNAVAMAVKQVELYGIDMFIKSGLSFANADERNLLRGVISRGIDELRELLSTHGVL